MQQLMRFKYWLYILVGLGVSIGAAAQSTTVSGTVTDQGGQVWANGTISYVFQNNGSFNGPYQWNSGNLPNQYLTPQIVTLSGSGTFSFSIPTSTAIAPALSTWKYVVCPNASFQCAILTVPSAGSTQNISSQITAAAATLVNTIQAGPMPLAYTDAEIITTPNQGGIYFNVTSFLPKYFDGSSWHFYGSGGSGGIPTSPLNCLIKINGGAGSCSSLFDNGTMITTGEMITAANFNGVVLTTGAATNLFLNGAGNYVLATGSPTGTAGGDLSGTYPNPTVAQVNGAVVPISTPVLGTNSSRQLVDVSTKPFIYASLNMPHWRAALAKVKQGTGNARLCAVGDSTTAGFFANGPSTGNSNVFSYPTQLANILQTSYGIKAQSQAVFEGGQELPGGNDPRIVVGSSWSLVTTLGGIPNATSQATTSTNALSFTPSSSVDTFRILYVTETTEGTGSVNIDGGTSTGFTGTGAAGVGVLTVTAGSVGTHTLNIFEVSGSVHIIGFEAYDSTQSQIIIENIGAPGVKASDLAKNTNPYNAGTAAMYIAIGCDIVNLNDGINDWGTGVSVATYTSNMQIVITAIKTAGSDTMLESPNHSDPTTGIASEATQSTFVEALRGLSLANSNNNLPSVPLPFDDTWNRWQTFAISNALGLYGDPSGTPSEHPGTVGYREKADQIAHAIAQTPSQNNGQWDYRTLFQVNPNTQTLIAKYQLSAPNYTDTGLISAACVGTNSSGLLIVGTCSGGGSGTVTSVSSGNLSPLFTVSVATATTTPAFTFTATAQSANTVYGNFTGSSAPATFSASPVFSAANLTSFPTFNQNTTGQSGTVNTIAGNLSFTNFTTTGVGTLASPYSVTGITLAGLPSLSANTVLGALTATTPSGLAMPSCSGASNALTWTSGTGFGCNTITGGSGITFPQTVAGTVNSGGIIFASSTAQISVSATNTAGQAVLWGGAGTTPGAISLTSGGTATVLVRGVTTSGNNDLIAFNGTGGDSKDSGVASTNLMLLSGAQTATGAKTFSAGLITTTFGTSTNCSQAVNPAVCGSAASGNAVVAAAGTTVVINTTAVTVSSQIQLTFDSSLGTKLGVTCNTTPSILAVSARSGGVSFTVTTATPAVNPACFSYTIIN